MSLPVACALMFEPELHIGHRASVSGTKNLQNLTLLFQTGQTSHEELMGILREEREGPIKSCKVECNLWTNQHILFARLLFTAEKVGMNFEWMQVDQRPAVHQNLLVKMPGLRHPHLLLVSLEIWIVIFNVAFNFSQVLFLQFGVTAAQPAHMQVR